MGLLIDSPVLGERLAAGFDDNDVPRQAYEVRLTPGGRELQWIELTPTGGA